MLTFTSGSSLLLQLWESFLTRPSRRGISLPKSIMLGGPLSGHFTGSPAPTQVSECELPSATALSGAPAWWPRGGGHSTEIRALGGLLVVVSPIVNWLTWAGLETSLT